MKVIGTRGSEVFTTRLERCELDPLRVELREQIAVIRDSLSHERHHHAHPPAGAASARVNALHEELTTILGIVHQLDRVNDSADGSVEITGPASVMGQVLRGAALEAVERLRNALDEAFEPTRPLADDLRAAARTAHASIQSLSDYYAAGHPQLPRLAQGCSAARTSDRPEP